MHARTRVPTHPLTHPLPHPHPQPPTGTHRITQTHVHQIRHAAGDEASDWDLRVLEAQQAVTIQARALAGTYGGLLNVSTDDVLWGMGQVIVHS